MVLIIIMKFLIIMVTKKKKKRESYYYNYLHHVMTSTIRRRRRRRRSINQLLLLPLLLLLMNTSRTSNAAAGGGGGSGGSSNRNDSSNRNGSSSSNGSSITITQQEAAVMGFKQSSILYDPSNFLSSWSYNTSCCSWSGITCSSGGLLTSIDLSHRGLSGPLHLSSLLSPSLPSLLHLHLQGNSFYSSSSSYEASYCSLLSLDLSSNNLSDPIPASSFLGVCRQSLRYLNLSRNAIPGGGIPVGPSLEQLDLSRNRISDFTLFNSCQSLTLLNLSDNHLSGPLTSMITPSSCHSLSLLDLSYNNFSSGFSSLDVSGCPNLSFLSLSHNALSDSSFPNTLPDCHLLETLDLSHNDLLLPIPGALLGGLHSIRDLSLAHNHLFGEVPPELGRACATLGLLDLSWNNLTGGLPPTFLSCSSLHTLNLGNNLLSGDFITSVVSNLQGLNHLYLPFNNITGPIPSSLGNCTRLQVIDLSSNAFTAHVPSNLCSPANASPLRRLLLANNYLSGQLPPELGHCNNLTTIDLSFNNLDGPIPWELWSLPNLSDLVMWANNLTGEIPQGICSTNGATLQSLILNNNLLTGSIPQSIANCTSIIWVSLSSNSLAGEIPSGIGSLLNLAILQLGNNSLTGPIPPEMGKCKSLIWLDLNSNDLSGPIPAELAEQSGVIVPGMVSGKQFAFVRNEGGSSCRGAGGLVEFEGIRAERLEKFPMVHSCPTTRIYSGMTVYTFGSNGSMIYLDMSYNSLWGSIPQGLGSMSYLQVLNLGHNMLTGDIPDSLGGLKVIGVLDLSHNHLQGSIPSSLGTLSFLSDLDLSNNNLSGLIPSGGQLTTFPASRYDNNSALCGLPLPPCSPTPHSTGHLTHGKKQTVAAAMLIGVAFFVLCLSLLTLALYRFNRSHRKEERREKYVESLPTSASSSSGGGGWKLSGVADPLSINVATFEKPLRKLTFAHLLEATNGFSAESLIGSGGFGEVYKAELKEGCVVAIKKLIHVTGQGEREFMAEMETIGKIKHRNLVPLMGYCKVGEERLLVYEYMKWGSLEAVLQDKSKGCSRLDWAARKKIAIGAARGLAFLHHSCMPHIIHRDMKSSNVLLDENMEARVSDFGMARLVNAVDTHLSVSTLAGTPGYVPPEYYQSFRCTTKGDVYSYGVILLELVSGRKAIDPGVYGEDNNLVGWAKQLHKEKRSWEILDKELTHHLDQQSQMALSLTIAFHCLDDRPFKRPTMIQVLTQFKHLLHLQLQLPLPDSL